MPASYCFADDVAESRLESDTSNLDVGIALISAEAGLATNTVLTAIAGRR